MPRRACMPGLVHKMYGAARDAAGDLRREAAAVILGKAWRACGRAMPR